MQNMQWWSNEGLSSNKVCSWRWPRPDVTVWSNASPWASSAVNDDGVFFQKTWDPSEAERHINFLELRAARLGFRELVIPGQTVQPYLDNMTARAHIRKMGGTRSRTLCTESLGLWREACQRQVTVRPPYCISSEENAQADFLSRYRLEKWDFKLLHSEYQKVCRALGVVPTLDAFASQRCHQLSRFMSWDTEDRAIAVNALVRQWDPG